MPVLLFLSMSYTCVVITADRFQSHASSQRDESYSAPTASEVAREVDRQGKHIDNVELAIATALADVAVLKSNQLQVMNNQEKMADKIDKNYENLNGRFDKWFYFFLALMGKALLDLANQYVLPTIRGKRDNLIVTK